MHGWSRSVGALRQFHCKPSYRTVNKRFMEG
jgi:hypothetical protein